MNGAAKQRHAGGRVRTQMRQERRKREAQKRFIEPLTPKRAGKIAAARSGTEYKPVIRSIAAQARASQKREGDLGQWYNQAANDVGAAIPRAQAGTAATIGAVNDQLASAAAADQSNLKTLSEQDAAFAKLVGGPTNASGLSQAAASAGARAQQAIALNAPTAAAGANYVNELGAKQVATQERGIEARGAENSRRRKILEDLQAAKKQRGQATVKNMNDLREGEREAQTTRLAFGLDKRKAAISARQGAASIAVSRKNAATSARNAATSERSAETSAGSAAETARHDRATERNSGGLTPTQRRAAHRTQKNANVTANALYAAAKTKPATPQAWSAFVILVGKEVGDQVAARKAVNRLKARLAGGAGTGTAQGGVHR